MVVRAKTGRKRYIAFEIIEGGEGLTRSKLTRIIDARALELGLKRRPEVILIMSGKGIIRTDHHGQAEAKEILNSVSSVAPGLSLRTLLASGTIRTIKQRYFTRAEES